MACSLIKHKRITTTVAKAKALKKFVEPLITKAKDDTTNSRRVVFSNLQDKYAVTELFKEISVKIAKYNTTRVCRIILGFCNQRLNELLQSFSLCNGRSDSFVLYQRTRHISQHSVSMRGSTTQMVEFLIMSHFLFFI
jgi:ribosomal protein L17